MLEKFIFENHLGLRFVGLEYGVYMNYNDLRDYSWSYDTINNKISRFYRNITERKLPLIVYCNSDEEAIEIKNRIHELAESDIEAKIPGKIFIGDYYTKGYITASTKSEYLLSKRLVKLTLTLTSENPAWYKEQTTVFLKDGGGETETPNRPITSKIKKDFPYDYPYDYSLSSANKKIVCDTVRGSNFRLKIYGEITNPSVIIGGHTYAINGAIGKGESVLIDSAEKTITLITVMGNKVNWYDKRNREDYIFQLIPSGQSTVVWNGNFGFDLTVIEERSEPKWT